MQRLMVTTGGTGGHIFPALAVCEEVLGRHPQCEVLFVGGSGPEGDMARRAGLAFAALPAKGVLGTGVKKLFSAGWILRGLWGAGRIIKRFSPQVVAGFGGYASFCPVLAAQWMGLPTALHEQNSVPGAANRLLAKRAAKVFVSFAEAATRLDAPSGRGTEHVGNPVRAAIAGVPEKTDFSARRVLVLGGSQGARGVNDAVLAALPLLKDAGVTLRHQAGRADEERVRAAYAAAGADADAVAGFIDDMAGAYAWADLVLCRAGASTLFEVAAAGRPSLLVPFPHATHDHQAHNARALEAAGGARVIAQQELTGEGLARTVNGLFDAPETLARMARGAKAFARPDAAARMADGLEALAAEAA